MSNPDNILKKMLIVMMVVLIGTELYGQPGWSVVPTDYAYSGEVNAAIIYNGNDVTTGILAAFEGDSCRGVEEATLLSPVSGRYYYPLFIYSDSTAGDTITFKYYNEVDGLIYELPDTLIFSSNMQEGDAEFPLEFVAADNHAPEVSLPTSDLVLDEYFGYDTTDISGVFSDQDGDSLLIDVYSSNAQVVTVSFLNDSIFITEQGTGSANVILTAVDDGAANLSVSDTFLVTVIDINVAPDLVVPLDDVTYNEGFENIQLDLSGAFSDRDGDQLTFSALRNSDTVVQTSISGAFLNIIEIGTGETEIVVTATDNGTGNLFTSDTFMVKVNNLNDPPLVSSPIANISENEGFDTVRIDLGAVFSDPDGDTLSFAASSSNNSVVSVSFEGDTLLISEMGIGTATITITASDTEFSVSDQFNFSVGNINDPPEVLLALADRDYDERFGAENINLSVHFADPDGDVLTYNAFSSNVSVVQAEVSGSILTITEQGIGDADITIVASDGTLELRDTVRVVVNNVNDTPAVVMPHPDLLLLEYFQSDTVLLSGVFSDPDGDTLTYSAQSNNPGVVMVHIVDSLLIITEQDLGTARISVTASDTSFSVTDQFRVTVENVNDAPVVIMPVSDRSYDERFISDRINLLPVFDDQDGDILEYTAVSTDTSIVKVSISGSSLITTEAGIGEARVIVTATDGLLAARDTFLVTVNNINDPPVLSGSLEDMEFEEYFGSDSVDLSGLFTDPDGDTLLISFVSDPAGIVELLISGHMLIITEQELGITTVSLTADDGEYSVNTSFELEVMNVNDTPQVMNPLQDISLDEQFESYFIDLEGVFSDKDGDALELTAISSDTSIVKVILDGSMLEIIENSMGSAMISVSASDGQVATTSSFSLSVDDVNFAPIVASSPTDLVLMEYFDSIRMDLSGIFSDPDGDSLEYTISLGTESVASIMIIGDTLVIYEDQLGSTSIEIVASDIEFEVSTSFGLSVENVNDPPVLLEAFDDKEIIQGRDTLSYHLVSAFADKDQDALQFNALVADTLIARVEISEEVMRITGTAAGVTEIIIYADDGEVQASDTLLVSVVPENELLFSLDGVTIASGDTIYQCNTAGNFAIEVQSDIPWGFSNPPIWIALDISNDSTLNIGYSENLMDTLRTGKIELFDEQGHRIEFVLHQSETCNPTDLMNKEISRVEVYPNPVSGRLYIDLPELGGSLMSVEIIDSNGRLVEQVRKVAGDLRSNGVDMYPFDPGLYFIRISDQDNTFIEKVIKR